jgi:hypothetical protein
MSFLQLFSKLFILLKLCLKFRSHHCIPLSQLFYWYQINVNCVHELKGFEFLFIQLSFQIFDFLLRRNVFSLIFIFNERICYLPGG